MHHLQRIRATKAEQHVLEQRGVLMAPVCQSSIRGSRIEFRTLLGRSFGVLTCFLGLVIAQLLIRFDGSLVAQALAEAFFYFQCR